MKKRLFVAAFIIILSLTLFLCAGSADVLAASSDEEKISPLTVTRETADELARECIKEGKDGLGKRDPVLHKDPFRVGRGRRVR